MRARPLFCALTVIAVAALLAGCAGGGRSPAGPRTFGRNAPPAGQVFRFNNGAEPGSIDPPLAGAQPEGRIASALFEGLVRADPATLAPLPAQAERWEISPDGLVYLFHLRRGLVWSDGSPLGADDFAWSWRRALAPVTGSRSAGLLAPIAGADSLAAGRADASFGARALDDTTLEVRLAKPTPHLLDLLSLPVFLPVPRAAVARFGDRWTRPEHLAGNGAFRLRAWRPREVIELDANPRYWDAARVRLRRVLAYPVDDVSTSTNLYRAGAIDWNPSGNLPSAYLPFLAAYADFVRAPQQAVFYFSLNVTRPPLADARVRRALSLALDRATLADRMLRGTRPAWGRFCPAGYAGYEPPPAVPFDPARARAELASAGYPGGRGFPRLEILINVSEDRRRLAEAVQAMWTRTLGIPVAITSREWGTYLDDTARLRYQVAARSWVGDYPDPSSFLDCYRGGDGNNRTGWASPAYDRLLEAASREPDRARRLALLARAEALLLDQGPVVPVYQFVTAELVKPYVRGLHPTPLDAHPLRDVWIDHGDGRLPAAETRR